MKRIQLSVMLIMLTFLIVACSLDITNSQDLSYKGIISNQYSNPKPNIQVEKILWEKTINDNEIILLFLNKENTISLAKLANVKGEWKARVDDPVGSTGDEVITWQWKRLSRFDEDNPIVAAVVWGYIYSPNVDKVLVGSDKKLESLKEAQILEFEEQNIKLYYFLTDDETGFEHNNVIAYDDSGKVLYNNRKFD